MNLMEGANRIQRVGRILTITSFCAGVLALLMIGLITLLPRYISSTIFIGPPFAIFAVIGWYSMLFGTALWVVGWIVEGFAQPNS